MRALLLALALAAAPARADNLVLEVRLEQALLSEAVVGLERQGEVLLPMCELVRLLELAIRCEHGKASGYVFDEKRLFRYDPAAVFTQDGELYAPARLLAQWLPVDLALDMPTLTLRVHAREKLPLRGRRSAADGAAPAALPLQPVPYALASAPLVDQTLSLAHTRGRSTSHYSAFATADLLGMQAALFLNLGCGVRGDQVRLNLARHDPDGGLLGPLHARSVEVGSIVTPGLANVALPRADGSGVQVSSHAPGMPLRFGLHTLQGPLAPGWDVELFFNDALAGTQQAGPDGRYRFADIPLQYGLNEFRLVFHGPLGQRREERHSVVLNQSQLAPGELAYSASVQRQRAGLQLDWGLAPQLAASAALQRLQLDGAERRYASAGLHGYWHTLAASAEAVRASDGGRLVQASVRTRVAGAALSASRAYARDFASEVFLPSSDPVRVRDELRIDTPPVSLLARHDRFASGVGLLDVALRTSAYRYGAALSHTLRWHHHQLDGMLQASRRVGGTGLSGQLQYTVRPRLAAGTLVLAAERQLGDGLQFNATLARAFGQRRSALALALNKSLGSYGLGLQASHDGAFSAALVLFSAIGREPYSARWSSAALPRAASAAAAVRLFLDRDQNGIMDGADTPLAGAGLRINGASQLARSGPDGVALVEHLPPYQHASIEIDPGTLDDPQWMARGAGARIVPRPGKVAQLDLAVSITGEIDGNAWLAAQGSRRPAGQLEIELVDVGGKVVASTRSAADGYYVLSGIPPGKYTLRAAAAQLARLGLRSDTAHSIAMDSEGSLVSARDLVVSPSDA